MTGPQATVPYISAAVEVFKELNYNKVIGSNILKINNIYPVCYALTGHI